MENITNKCLTAHDILDKYGIYSANATGSIEQKLTQLCPVFLEQVTTLCAHDNGSRQPSLSVEQKYTYTLIAVLVISLCSLMGVIFYPLMKSSVYNYIMNIFVSLAVGTMLGDAIIHLLPEAFAPYKVQSSQHDDDTVLWKAVLTIASIQIFFIFETAMDMFTHKQDRDMDKTSYTDIDNLIHSPEVDKTERGIKPVAFMIILADSLHNAFDGLAIAAAFSIGWSSGIATSITVFCHEVPHEIGNFAILLNSCMSFKVALLCNVVSALTSFLGALIGIAIANSTGGSQWIFGVIAGTFLYIALADMIPELLEMQRKGSNRLTLVCLQNCGLLFGTAFLAGISILEEEH